MKLGVRIEKQEVLFIEGPPDDNGTPRRLEFRPYTGDDVAYWSAVFRRVQEAINKELKDESS